ncbi:MAG: S-layer homology domain-containing protein [Solibacillus sp.]
MKKITRLLSIVGLASALLLSANGTVSASEVHYKDVNKEDNFYKSVEYLLDKNAISSTLPNFRPYENITRGQFASIFARSYDNEFFLKGDLRKRTFDDVPKSHQFYPYVTAMVNYALMQGYRDGSTFGINDSLTRGQMAGILVRAYDIPLIDTKSYKEHGGVKSDIFDGIQFKGQWGQAIATLDKLGVMSGYGDGSFKPSEPIKRSQFANMLVKQVNGHDLIDEIFLLKGLTNLGVSEKVALEKIQSLKDNDVINYVTSYNHYTYDGIPNHYPKIFVLDIHKEGEVLFEDINIKMVVSKSSIDYWKFTFEKIEQPTSEKLTTTQDTAAVETN